MSVWEAQGKQEENKDTLALRLDISNFMRLQISEFVISLPTDPSQWTGWKKVYVKIKLS